MQALHDPLTTDARGAVPAFDQLANGQNISGRRANRIPRVPMARPGLCRRLHSRIKAALLKRGLRGMRARLDVLEAEMADCTEQAIGNARRHQFSPELQTHRLALRLEHKELATKWLAAVAELDLLQASL